MMYKVGFFFQEIHTHMHKRRKLKSTTCHQGKMWVKCLSVISRETVWLSVALYFFTYSKDSCHKTELHNTIWGLGHGAAWRCLPRHWNNHKSKRTAAGLCVHTVALEFTHPQKRTQFFFSPFLSPLSFHPDLQLGSGGAFALAGETRRPTSSCTSLRRAKCTTWLTCLRTRRSRHTAATVEPNTGWWS